MPVLPKNTEVISTIRGQILRGDLAPGGRLPTRLEMSRKFKTTPVTVQKAMAKLSEDGFLVSRGRAGTFVVDHPPHLSRYGVAFAYDIADSNYSLGVADAARRLDQARTDLLVSCYADIRPDCESKDRQRLRGDIESHRLAGLIMILNPRFLAEADDSIVTQPGLPRVAIAQEFDVPGVYSFLINEDFASTALKHLAEQGCRRVAMLTNQNIQPSYVAAAQWAARSLNVSLARRDILAADPHNPWWSAHCIEAIFGGDPADRPDGLIIADDHLVESATQTLAALHDAHPRVSPRVVASCNAPSLPRAAYPVTWLGVDLDQVMVDLIQMLSRVRAGEPIDHVIRKPARFLDPNRRPTKKTA